ncbi:hypothetical protein [Streptosporangium roseum]|uniref:hypothetical protein n=1 Tax=Streptosporangium roseum TaxID=2001 RepID=UPI0004CD8550|nr:hypothetical protein [Streptosporangium roseum]
MTTDRDDLAAAVERTVKSSMQPLALSWTAHNTGVMDKLKSMTKFTEDLGKQVTQLREGQALLAKELKAVAQSVNDLRAQVELNAGRAEAWAELHRLTAEMKEEFASRNHARRLARSLITELVAAAVRDRTLASETVRQAVSTQMLSNGEYWLGPAVVAVAAELLEEEELRNQAWSLATAADKSRSTLFLALVHSLRGDEETAARSMSRYLESLNPRALGGEFFHVLNALAEEELGEKALTYAKERLSRWAEEIDSLTDATNPAYSSQRDACRRQLLAYHAPLPDQDYLRLRPLAEGQWQRIEDGWKQATACGTVATHFRSRFAAVESGPRSEYDHIRHAIEALINHPGPDELEYLRSIRQAELVVESGGNGRAAQAASELNDPLSETIDLPTLLTRAAFAPEKCGIGERAQRLALAYAGGWIIAAGQSVAAQATEHRPARVQVTQVRWPNWRCEIDAETPEANQADRLADDLCAHIERAAEQVRYDTVRLGFGGVGLAAALLSFPVADGAVAWMFLLFGLLSVIWALPELGRVPRERKRISEQTQQEKRRARDSLRGAVEESTVLLERWNTATAAGLRELQECLADLRSDKYR